jgi:DNA-binding transcriptional ArsR family regulator
MSANGGAVQTIEFGPADAGRCRFAMSPLWETASAVRTIATPESRAYHLPWFDAVRAELETVDIAPLLWLMPFRGYTPDFISPIPTGPHDKIEGEIARIRRTPLRQVAAEIERSFAERGGQRLPAAARTTLADPRRARTLIADLLTQCWRLLVEPHWPRLHDILAADIAHQTRRLGDRGLQALLPDLHPKLHWRAGSLQIDTRIDGLMQLGGLGLVLMPSVFIWPMVVWTDPPSQPTLVYPARGIAELWRPNETPRTEALGRLLGRTRALLLASLNEPASTTALARRHLLSPGTVSEHLSTLRDAGLVVAVRRGRDVSYGQTRLGAQLAGQRPRGDGW